MVRSRRKEQADQVQLSLITSDDVDFVKFRKLLHTGDFLVILKHKERLSYDCIGIRAADENNGEYHLSVLNNKFYKLPTNTKVDIKKYIKIKDSKVENRNITISELGNILKEMYSNAENKMQVASIHIFGIKYGKNIIQKAFKSLDIVKAAGINESYSTELEMAKANGVNVYHYLTYLLEKVPNDRMSDDELELLAPWNETVKAEIERRANESNQSYVNCQGAPATEK